MGTAASDTNAAGMVIRGGVGTTTLNRSTQGATHESPNPPVPEAYLIGATTPWYSAAAMPTLPRISKARPTPIFVCDEIRGCDATATTRSATAIDTTPETQCCGSATKTARTWGISSDGSGPAMKYPTAYTRATARRRRTASASRSGGRVQPLDRSADTALSPTGISVFFWGESLGMGRPVPFRAVRSPPHGSVSRG